VDYGWLGINVGDLSIELQEDIALENRIGAFVYGVFQGSPADRAGILPGDFIIKINDEKIQDSTSLIFTVANLPIGKNADFELLRYGEQMQLQVKIAVRKADEEIQQQRMNIWPGLSVVKITDNIQQQLNLPRKMGELIISNVSPEGPAGIAGFRPGDVIKTINGDPVRTVVDFYKTINDKSSNELMFRIYRQKNEFLIGLVR
jgi:S1-C subfamily serine protease